MKKVRKILLVVVGIAIYLNIGWMIGTYCYDNVWYTAPEKQTTLAKIASGGWMFNASTNHPSKVFDCVIVSFFWPIVPVALAAVSWIGQGIYYILWFIFAGGIAKTLGLA